MQPYRMFRAGAFERFTIHARLATADLCVVFRNLLLEEVDQHDRAIAMFRVHFWAVAGVRRVPAWAIRDGCPCPRVR